MVMGSSHKVQKKGEWESRAKSCTHLPHEKRVRIAWRKFSLMLLWWAIVLFLLVQFKCDFKYYLPSVNAIFTHTTDDVNGCAAAIARRQANHKPVNIITIFVLCVCVWVHQQWICRRIAFTITPFHRSVPPVTLFWSSALGCLPIRFVCAAVVCILYMFVFINYLETH